MFVKIKIKSKGDAIAEHRVLKKKIAQCTQKV